jgi:hypothetical protein
MTIRRCVAPGTPLLASVVAVIFVAGSPRTAAADAPEFEFEDAAEVEEIEGVEWNARAQGSLVNTTGNSQTTAVSGGARASRRAGNDRFRVEGQIAYARAALLVGQDLSGTGFIDEESEIARREEVTSQAWSSIARYDRFFTARNSLYAAALAGADRPAGRSLDAGGQVGYSRVLLKEDGHELTGETGYDFSYERFVAAGAGVAIHSGRLFLGYAGKLTDDTQAEISAEALTNFNPLTKPTRDIGVLGDTRLRGRAAITTKLLSNISFQGSFSARFQSAPAPLPPLDLPYAPGFVPEAKKLDTITELTLIVTIL